VQAFVERQIEIIRPEVIVTLGRIALQTLMATRDQDHGNKGKLPGLPGNTCHADIPSSVPAA